MRRSWKAWMVAAVWVMACPVSQAVIVFQNPGRLTTMPVLAGGVKPGWQYLGLHDDYAGIPIGPRAWVTAAHVAPPTATLSYANAGTTGTIAYASARAASISDLAVMVLDAGQPSFTVWAPIWSSTTTLVTNQQVYMYGRGPSRGDVVTSDYLAPDTPAGWRWVGYDHVPNYGTNRLSSYFTYNGSPYIAMDFDQPTAENGLPDTQGMLATGDSGSGVFSLNPATNQWELLGINYAVDLFSTTPGGPLLGAAIYDARGFYAGNDLVTGTAPVPGSSYATPIPAYYSFLQPYLVPEPSAAQLVVAAAAAGLAVRLGSSRRARAARRRGEA